MKYKTLPKKERLCLLCGKFIELGNFEWEPHKKLCEEIYIEARPWLKEILEKEKRDEELNNFKLNRQ